MNSIADALVYAVTYLNLRDLDSEDVQDDDADVGALESVAAFLRTATPAEQDALANAAERALAAEQIGGARPEFVQDYESWMEDMFGDGWEGNRRIENQE